MNRLAEEKSPYLLQHKDNPVHWYAWGEEAFAAARAQSKPIFLSIGYSTCYWCHVMEKDSFELQEVADVLNRDYISIKLDREERPDVDQIYMDAVVALTGHGGWPMSVFLTPDLKPFWGGTFFYRAQFISILEQLAEAWKKENQSVLNSAEKITGFLSSHLKFDKVEKLDPAIFNIVSEVFLNNYDSEYAGFGNAPKFPPAMQISHLISEYTLSKNVELKQVIDGTLEAMYRGGLYDRLGGGFHRYSVDQKWLVPHFEKMLYDNALLAVTYLEAFQLSGNELYLKVSREVLDYLLLEMRDERGGFYAAEDAGEVGKEGEFYVWTEEELRKTLTDEEYDKIASLLGVTSSGNFEHGTNILHVPLNQNLELLDSELFSTVRKKLLIERSKRLRPHRDDKIITSWCALAISAFAKMFGVTQEVKYLNSAESAAKFIWDNLYKSGKLRRHFFKGNSSAEGVLEDYANFTAALIDLYLASSNISWINRAKEMQEVQDTLLWNEEGGAYNASVSPELIVQKQEFMDNAVPSGNSVSFLNLVRLSDIFYSEKWSKMIDRIADSFAPLITRYPSAFPKFAKAYRYKTANRRQIVLSCKDRLEAQGALKKFATGYHPFDMVLLSFEADQNKPELPDMLKGKKTQNGALTFYICANHSCQPPTNQSPF